MSRATHGLSRVVRAANAAVPSQSTVRSALTAVALVGVVAALPAIAHADQQAALPSQSSQGLDVYAENASQTTGVNPIVPGETMIVRGRTNLNPEETVIVVELFDSRSESVRLATTDTWGEDGLWTVRMNTSGLSTGTYVIEVGTDTTDNVVRVEFVAERTPVTEATVGSTPGATPHSTPTSPSASPTPSRSPEPSPSASPTPGESNSDGTTRPTPTQSGFGVLVATGVVIATALLAGRRWE